MEREAHWRRVEDIYHRALQHDSDARAAFVASEAADDTRVAADVESLLETHRAGGGFLETPAFEQAAAWLDDVARIPRLERISHYRVIELVGAGGMGAVYRAWDEVLEREVALKVLRPEIDPRHHPSRLRREAQAVARLAHPGICAIHEVGEEDGHSFLVMELVTGRTLSDVVAQAPLTAAQACRFGAEIADALAHAHQRGVLHRDLKPANVIVCGDHVKVVDFGIARRLDRPALEALTHAGAQSTDTLAGTVAYMAPELLRGRPADARSDIWALGVLLHECMSGILPFSGDTDFEVASAILERPAPPLPADAPPAVGAIVARCLAKDPDARFETAADVRDLLVAARQPSPSVPGPMMRSSRASHQAQRPARRIGITAGIMVVLLGVFGTSWWLKHPASPQTTPELAVLPFEVESHAAGAAYLALGVADEITKRLANVASLRVRPTPAVADYLKRGDIRLLPKELKVTHLLQGSLREFPQAYEASVRLTTVGDPIPLWAETVRVDHDGLMRLEERIAARVAHALAVPLSGAERTRMERQHTMNPAAHEADLMGRTALWGLDEPDVDSALRSFRQALTYDPDDAQALAGLAIALIRRSWYAGSPEESMARFEAAYAAAKRAVDLAPSLAAAHEAVAAVCRYREFQWETVIQESAKALELSPSLELPYYNMAAAFSHLGLFDLADGAARQGLEINPRSRFEALRNLGRSALYDGRYETAAEYLSQAEAVSDDGPRWLLGEAWFYLKDYDRSIALLERVEGSKQYVMRNRATASLATVLAARGHRQDAERRLSSLIHQPALDHHVSYRIGTAYAQLGSANEAVHWLRGAVDTGFPCYSCLERDPLLDSIRDDPAFVRLLTDLRPTADYRRTRFAAQTSSLF